MTDKERINIGDMVLTNRELMDGDKKLPIGTEGKVLTGDGERVTIEYKDGDRTREFEGAISVDYLEKA